MIRYKCYYSLLFIILIVGFGKNAFSDGMKMSVTAMSDDFQKEGTLRTALHYACDVDGDDEVTFFDTWMDEWHLNLTEPLVIPANCKGHVYIKGLSNVKVVIDAHEMSDGGVEGGDKCAIHVYSDGNTIDGIVVGGNKNGAGICLFGRNNTIVNTLVTAIDNNGEIIRNINGIVLSDIYSSQYPEMDGSNNFVRDSDVQNSVEEGVIVRSDSNIIEKNSVHINGGDGIVVLGGWNEVDGNIIELNGGCSNQTVVPSVVNKCFSDGSGGVGVRIAGDAENNVIGSGYYSDTAKNIIRWNRDGGVVVESNARYNTVTHNSVFENFGKDPVLDLFNDGITANDTNDLDDGANDGLNKMDHLQYFPDANGYVGWGVSFSGVRAEIYGVSVVDQKQGLTFGGGSRFIQDVSISESAILFPYTGSSDPNTRTTSLVFDELGNTSEFGLNVPVGPDSDLDGLPDWMEGNGFTGSQSANNMIDTDDDGLPDAIEDSNRNGKQDKELTETSNYIPDSDGDGVSDWYELHGDPLYNVALDMHPLDKDTDGDGLSDGLEDNNHNGVWEGYLGETSPLLVDSDGDHVNDNVDNCPMVPNPGQEPFYCN